MSYEYILADRLHELEIRVGKLEQREHTHLYISFGVPTSLVISGGVITIDRYSGSYSVDTEGAVGSDDLDSILGGEAGDLIIIKAENDARSIVCKNGTGNLKLPADMTLDNTKDIQMLYYDGTDWCEVTASSNA